MIPLRGAPALGTHLSKMPVLKNPAPLSSSGGTGSSAPTSAPEPSKFNLFPASRTSDRSRTTGASGSTEGERVGALLAKLAQTTEENGASRTVTGCIVSSKVVKESTSGSRRLDVGTPSELIDISESSNSIEGSESPTPGSMPALEASPTSPEKEKTFTFPSSTSEKESDSLPPLETPTASKNEGTFTFSKSESDPKSEVHSSEHDHHREYHTWTREQHMEVSSNIYSGSKILRQSCEKSERGNAFYVYHHSQIEEHVKKFEGACAYIITEANLDKFGRETLGCPDGTLYVSTVDAVADVLESSGGDVAAVNKKLGVNWPFDSVLKVITIEDPKKFLVTMSAGNEHTANNKFTYGGSTIDGVPEAVLHKNVPKGAYTESTPAQYLAKHRAKKEGS